MIADHWKIVLDRHADRDGGDIYVAQDGEVIGRWRVDENGFYYFTPSGEAAPTFCDPFLNVFCAKVFDWHLTKQ